MTVSPSLTVRYFAAAAAAAGTETEQLPVAGPVSREALFAILAARHPTPPPGEPSLPSVLQRSSFLVAGHRLRADQTVSPGETVDILPPFSGG